MKHNRLIVSAVSMFVACLHPMAHAQATAGDAHRTIQDSAIPRQHTASDDALARNESAPLQIDRLQAVEVLGPQTLARAIERYWQSHLGKPVSNDALLDFQLWLSEETKRQGQWAFGITSKKSTPTDSDVLLVTLVTPTIHSIKLIVPNRDTANKYQDLLINRFAADFQVGAFIDIEGLDQRLEHASFDLPLNLEATVRAVGPERVDLLVEVTEIQSEPGQLKRAVVQVNNHGLKQFGREQVSGFAQIGGLAPQATLSLAALASQGLRYARAEYETPIQALAGRIKVAGSRSTSSTISGGQSATEGATTDWSVGLTRIENNWGDLILRSQTELSTRESTSQLASTGTTTSHIKDTQLRFGFSLDNERLRRDAVDVEGTLTFGKLSASANDAAPSGNYVRLESRGSVHYPVSADGRWFSVLKGKAQFASNNLDGYNRLSIGGNQGVRAYTTADGVGDAGLVGSIELNRRWTTGTVAGLFYDAGRIKPNKRAVTGVLNDLYTLQAVGIHINGHVGKWSYAAHVAKGLGGYKPAEAEPGSTESKKNAWRAAASVAYAF